MKTGTNKIIFSFCFLFFVSALGMPAFSQKPKVKKTIRAEGLLFRPVANKAFTSLFSGVFSTNLSLNFGVNNFNTGIFYNLMQSQIFPKYQSEPHAIQTVHTGGIRFSYDVYPSKAKMAATKGNIFMYSPYLSGGFSQVDYSRLQCITQQVTGKSTQTFSVNAGFNFNLMFSEYDGVGFTLGYSFLNHEFNPDALCLNEYYPDIEDKHKHGLSQYVVYGFNVHFDLVKRDPDSE